MGILDILFPKRCVGCGRIGKYFCAVCRAKIRIIHTNEAVCPVCQHLSVDGMTHRKCKTRYAPDRQTSFFQYDGPTAKAIKLLKYRSVTDLAEEFVSLIPPQLLRQIPRSARAGATLLPVPLHASRLRKRGFNQAEVLGQFLAHQLQVPLRTDILYRTKYATPQADIKDKKDRIKNMKNVFSISNPQFSIHNSTILLFDDVTTTGATLASAARELKRGGAKRVWAVTMAR